ncbi:MAG: hypothetical protein WBO28_01820 [Flavobacteriales bacterium]
MSQAVIDHFFAKQTVGLLSTSTDLALSKGYALLDDKDGRLFLGGSFAPNRMSVNAPLHHILTVGIKTNIKDQFATLAKGADLQTDIGLSVKYTFAFGASINYAKEDKVHKAKVRAFVKQQSSLAATQTDQWIKANALALEDNSALAVAKEKELKKQQRMLVEKTADHVEDEGLYTWLKAFWFSPEVYVPFTSSEYLVADSITTNQPRSVNYNPINMGASLSGMVKSRRLGTFFLTVAAGRQLNNSVLADRMTKTSFESYRGRGGMDTLQFARISENTVYIGQFKEFWTSTLTGSLTWMFPGTIFGISGSVEQWYGEVESTNWKLGLPVSLHGKDKDKRVNFELQWRERFNTHTVGISVGLPFGALL